MNAKKSFHRLCLVGVLFVALAAGVTCYAAPKPDLTCDLDGLQKAIKGTSCFDPDQPWYVCFSIMNFHHIGNAPVADAGPFTIQLDIMNGPKLDSGVFKTVTQVISDGVKAGTSISICLHLPKKIKHEDLGTKHAFRLTVDPPPPNGVIAEDDETNNVCEFDKGTEVPIAPLAGTPPPPDPDKNLKIIDTAAIPGEAKSINVRVKNLGAIDSKMMVMFLTVRSSGFGAVKSNSDDLNGIKVPSIAPGKAMWVKISAQEAFIQPTPKASKVLSDKASAPLFNNTLVGTKVIVVNVKKGSMTGAVPHNPSVVGSVAVPPDYKVLIPFTIEISGTHEKLSFGAPSLPPSGGVIKIPGKK